MFLPATHSPIPFNAVLQFTWITRREDKEQGIFICTFRKRLESFLY
ncbi:hypothetical protein MICAI_1490006 [Microcystis sp. T1-4]|nr:hypothetical protein MICAI_1490006 [Microcystis sp. T1-4]